MRKIDFKRPIPRMTPSKGLEAIKEISRHSFLWHDKYITKGGTGGGIDELNVVFEQIKDFDHSMKFVTEETQASSIKKLEVQLGKIARTIQNKETGSLPSSTEVNQRGLAHAITTRSGLNNKPPTNPLEKNEDSTNKQNKHKDGGTNDRDEVSQPVVQRRMMESYVPPIPFPSRLKKHKEKE
ncbi:hypothetical protein Tco_0855436 [Tanacetum coccineum]